MVFSQTSLNTRTVLKVVELDHLKKEKKNQVIGPNGSHGVIADGYSSNATPSSSVATTSFSEVRGVTVSTYRYNALLLLKIS